jgi:ligand-binding sensor domain-containing protein
MTGLRFAILCWLLACCGFTAEAQSFPELNFTHLTTLDGLSSDITTCVGEDRQGFIWIGTINGLNRYDGYRMKQYFHQVNDSNSLSGNEVQKFLCDGRGRMWIATSLGVSCFFPETNRFINYSASEPGPRHFEKVGDTPDIYEDEFGRIWLMPNKNELYRVREDMKLERMPFPGYSAIRRDTLHREWAFTDSLFFRLDPQTKRPVNTMNLARSLGRASVIGRFTTDPFGNHWVSAWQSALYNLDPGKKELATILPAVGVYHEPIDWEYGDQKWIVVPEENSGFYLVVPSNLQFKKYTPGLATASSLQGNWFRGAFVDRSGGLWICSDKGINRVAAAHTPYDIHSLTMPGDKGGEQIASGLPFGFGEVDSLYWINIRGIGTFRVSSSDLHTVGHYITLSPLGGQHPNPTSAAYSFFRKGDDLFIGTDSSLVDYRIKEKDTRSYRPASVTANAAFRTLVPVDNHTLWIRSWNKGVFVFDMDRKAFVKRYTNGDTCLHCLPPHLTYLLRLRSGKIFAASEGGVLLEYDPSQDFFVRRALNLLPGSLTDSIPAGNLYGMAEDEGGKLWICSRFGVLVYDPIQSKTVRVFSENGQMGETWRICFDHYGNAWVNGYSGIWIYERSSGKWVHFTSQDGLPPGDAEGFMTTDSKGNILCGIQNAIVRFYPSSHLWVTKDRPAIITEATTPARTLEFPLNNTAAKTLMIGPGENSFTLDFAVLNYVNGFQNQYYYRLMPLMKEFEKNSDGHLNFNGLSPGNYQLQVKGGDKFGNVFSVGDSLSVTIKPYFYQTLWFRLLFALLILGAIGLIAAKVVRNIRQEANLRQKISQSEMMALRAQMNPHFIFNCLNSIDNLIQDDQKEKATTYLAKFAKLIRAILELSKKETVPCWKDLEALRLYLDMESLRLNRQFHWSFDIDDRIIRGDYKIPPMILQPFVENAIHHGLMNKLDEDKQVRIEGQFIEGSLRFVVEDNGIGRSKAAEYKRINKPDHQSMGMEITQERINHFNADGSNTVNIIDLYTDDGKPAGTRIEICITNQN